MALHKHTLLTLATLAVLATAGARAGDTPGDSDLVLTFLIHRHGDRTPVQNTLAFSTAAAALRDASQPYGYGQLTNVGKQTAYRLGQFIRDRYDDILSAHYNSSEIYIRSTDSTRAKMTVLTAMAAVFPAGDNNWSDFLPWQPTPYTTVPARYDPNLAMLNCPTFIEFYYSKFLASSQRMERFTDVLEQWSDLLGFNITRLPVLAYAVYDVYTSQFSLGVPLSEELQALFSDITEVAGEAIDVIFGDDDYVALQAGVLLNDIVTAMELAASGEVSQPLRVYSAHDYNVYSLMAAARVTPRQGVPQYGAAFALELRRRTDTGDYGVLPVYLSSPGAEPLYLQVDGCSALLCPLEEFVSITAPYVLDEDTWRDQCAYTDDMVIDDSSIA